ncbi:MULTISPECIES: alpha-ketoglutarate-dependent dioxygenase AlkB [unclassified Sinorhizobium]|uniref:alpha-ketoglutarate-dependent dioxygenase AlkB n=1 Tax=unclassified Sinorhizobium TaxID=2613772 RepID=UPI0035259AFC
MNASLQGELFASSPPRLPEGFRYAANVVPEELQSDLLREIPDLPFKPFDFHGFEGKRRVVSYGWKYDFEIQQLRRGADIPALLQPLRVVAADFFGIEPSQLEQALVSEYAPGAPIGWHRDKHVFGRIIGVSLLSPCTFRLRRRAGDRWERASIIAEPGSAYLLSGPARTEWEHSIPPVEELRYSITFREISKP